MTHPTQNEPAMLDLYNQDTYYPTWDLRENQNGPGMILVLYKKDEKPIVSYVLGGEAMTHEQYLERIKDYVPPKPPKVKKMRGESGKRNGLAFFLKTKRTKEELKAALDVLQEFKASENQEEYLNAPFVTWMKLEQLEEFLEHLVNGKELKDDTREELRRKGIKVA